MNISLKERVRRVYRLPISLLLPALIAGFAAVGQAQGIPQMVITAERPTAGETSVDLRDQMRVTARRAVRKTQAQVGTDLSVKLKSRSNWIQLAGNYSRKRG